jgi:hypothetical protein
MSTPSPTALVIASLIESLLAPVFTAMSAPLLKRIEALEDNAHTPTEDEAKFGAAVMSAIRARSSTVVDFLSEEIVERAVSAVFADSEFDKTVLSVITDHPSDVIDSLGNNLTDKIAEHGDIAEKVAEVINRGSFSTDFTSF